MAAPSALNDPRLPVYSAKTQVATPETYVGIPNGLLVGDASNLGFSKTSKPGTYFTAPGAPNAPFTARPPHGATRTGVSASWLGGDCPAGEHLVSGFERSVDPQGVAAAQWALQALGPGHRWAEDSAAYTLLSTIGDQDTVRVGGALFNGRGADAPQNGLAEAMNASARSKHELTEPVLVSDRA